MLAPPSFHGLLAAAAALARRAEAAASGAVEEEPVLSLALPLQTDSAKRLDPLALLPVLGGADPFRFLWDGAPGLCLAASGRCNSLQLSGPRRFELAQRFCGLSLQRLAVSSEPLPPLARPRVLLAFAFFDSPLHQGGGIPGVEAVLPRWQLSRQGRHCWLRLQRGLGGAITPRSVAEELWEMARHLEALAALEPDRPPGLGAPILSRPMVGRCSDWREPYRTSLNRGLALVDTGDLRKLVLAARQRLELRSPLDPRQLLAHLRRSQPGSCRFLWQSASDEALLGASPERLLSVRQGLLRTDALAGTRPNGAEAADLLASDKDRHEHDLVVETISQVLLQAGLAPCRPRHPRLARHGGLAHLHTPITAALQEHTPLALAEVLHPTPAVAGLPRREAMAWLRTLEPFERGHYAAPIGWLDSHGDCELRVAIRSGLIRGGSLEITAGAGLVRGSLADREEREVALKLRVLQDQLLPVAGPSSKRAIV
ncbi:MAG: isochorismate synthase [Cyanobacteriota bacterium]|nr:isochorismate synthase [Cyanobacteriota bacterium]